MFRSGVQIGLITAAVAILLIAPVMFFNFAAARPRLAAASAAYGANAACTDPAARGLPRPAQPLSDAMRIGTPCAVAGAMVTEKDTLSQGVAGLTRYVVGLRTDAGAEYLPTLDGASAAAFWNSVQAGDRVLIQTFHGHAALVGDGTLTVPTDSNPSAAARTNATDLWVAGSMSALELIAVGMLAIWRRRSAASP